MTDKAIVTSLSDFNPLNELLPIELTVLGIVIFVSFPKRVKSNSLIEFTVDSKIKWFINEQPVNTFGSNFVR